MGSGHYWQLPWTLVASFGAREAERPSHSFVLLTLVFLYSSDHWSWFSSALGRVRRNFLDLRLALLISVGQALTILSRGTASVCPGGSQPQACHRGGSRCTRKTRGTSRDDLTHMQRKAGLPQGQPVVDQQSHPSRAPPPLPASLSGWATVGTIPALQPGQRVAVKSFWGLPHLPRVPRGS